MPAHSDNLCASFTLTGAEARRATVILCKHSGALPFTALSTVTLLLAIYSGFEHGWYAWYYFTLPLVYAVIITRQAFRLWPIRSGIATEFCLAEDGVHCERPRTYALSWAAIADTHDSGDLLMLFPRNRLWRLVGKRIVIPKRAFADDGVAATRLLADAPLRKEPRD